MLLQESEAQKAAELSTRFAVAQQDRQTEIDVMQRFWSVLMLRDVVGARELSLAVSDSSLSRAERMRAVGLLSDYDVLRVRVQAQTSARCWIVPAVIWNSPNSL